MSIPDEIDPHAFAETGSVRRIATDVWRIVAPSPSPLTRSRNEHVCRRSRRGIVIDPGAGGSGAHPAHPRTSHSGAVGSILCTHSHPDHSPGAVPLQERTGAPVYGMPPPDDGYQDETYAPDHGLCDGDLIQDGERALRVLHTPGHASNHACLLLEASGLLFTGDHLMSGSTVVILPPDGSMRLYVESLRRLREMPIADLAPGHGALIQGAHGEIDRVLAHRLLRESKVVAAFESRRHDDVEKILPVVYADVPRFMHPVAKFSLLAHAIKLEEEGRAVRDGETWSWRGWSSDRGRAARSSAPSRSSMRACGWDVISALRDASFVLRAGERWLVTGPNGAGKTVSAQAAAGDLWPTPTGHRAPHATGWAVSVTTSPARRAPASRTLALSARTSTSATSGTSRSGTSSAPDSSTPTFHSIASMPAVAVRSIRRWHDAGTRGTRRASIPGPVLWPAAPRAAGTGAGPAARCAAARRGA